MNIPIVVCFSWGKEGGGGIYLLLSFLNIKTYFGLAAPFIINNQSYSISKFLDRKMYIIILNKAKTWHNINML